MNIINETTTTEHRNKTELFKLYSLSIVCALLHFVFWYAGICFALFILLLHPVIKYLIQFPAAAMNDDDSGNANNEEY